MTAKIFLTLATAAAALTASARHMAPGEDVPVVIKANLICKNGKANGAICSITLPGNGTYDTLHSNSYFANNVAGVWADGRYYFTQCEEFVGTLYANFDAYNATSWERELHITSGLTWADAPTDLTLSLKDETVYGCFANAAHNGYNLASLDLITGRSTAIAALPQRMVAVAAHSGSLFTIGADGTLFTASATDGSLSAIGSTGITPDATKYQSATADPATGTIYWAAQLPAGASALYAINPASAEATKVFDFSASEQFVGLFIEGDDQDISTPDRPDTPDGPEYHENSFFEDFEACDGNYYHEWLPKGWEDRSALGHVGQSPDNWQSQQNLTWQVGALTAGTGHPAYAGQYCAFINVSTAWSNHPNEEQDEWLVTPAISVKNDEWLFFQYRYSPGWTRWNRQAWDYSGQNNTLEVHISLDGGETWSKLWDCMQMALLLDDAALEADRSTTDHPYQPVYVDLHDYADKSVRIAFRYVGIGGQSMSIDNVAVGLPVPVARYSLPEGIFREALSPRMTYPTHPVLWAPADTEFTWRQKAENAQTFIWNYAPADATDVVLTATTPDLTTPAYAKGMTVGVPSLQVEFGSNRSPIYTDNCTRMQIEGTITDTDEEGYDLEFGVANYDIADPQAHVGFNRTFGFDADSYDKWSGLTGRLVYTVIPSCAISAYPVPAKPYVISSIYANVKVEAISSATDITCDVWTTDETGTYITERIGTAHVSASEIESLYPDDPDNSSWSVLDFSFDKNPVYVDKKIYVMIGGFNLETDAVYFPGISTSNPDNRAESYFGVIDYNDDENGIFRLFDVNSYNIGTTGQRHLAGFLIGLRASYDIPESIAPITADTEAPAMHDLQGRRLNQRPTTGFYIEGGKKRVAK